MVDYQIHVGYKELILYLHIQKLYLHQITYPLVDLNLHYNLYLRLHKMSILWDFLVHPKNLVHLLLYHLVLVNCNIFLFQEHLDMQM